MRIRTTVATALMLGLTFSGLVAGTAHAADTATINTISPAPVPPGGKVKIAPKVSLQGDVKLTGKSFSIWNASGKKIASGKTSAWLKAGTYTVKTTATYKVMKRSGGYYPAKTIKRTQTVVVETTSATCATQADARRVKTGTKTGDTRTKVYWKLYSHGTLDGKSGSHEHWRYALCGSEVQWVWVSYDRLKSTGVWHATDVWVE